MSEHDPEGRTLCIHSVCVDRPFLRRGIALGLLKEYILHVRRLGNVSRLSLICHAELFGLYQRAGFTILGESPVQHGQEKWFEARLDL